MSVLRRRFVLSIVSGLPAPFAVFEEAGTDATSRSHVADGNEESETLWRADTTSAFDLALKERRLKPYTRDPASGEVRPSGYEEWAPRAVSAVASQAVHRTAEDGVSRLILFDRAEFERWLGEGFEIAVFSQADWSAIASR